MTRRPHNVHSRRTCCVCTVLRTRPRTMSQRTSHMLPHQKAHRTRTRRPPCIVPVLSNSARHRICAGNPPQKTPARKLHTSRLPSLPRIRTCHPRGLVLDRCKFLSTCIPPRTLPRTCPTSTVIQQRSPPPGPLSKPRKTSLSIRPHTHTPQTPSTCLDHCMFRKRCTKYRNPSRSSLGCRIRPLPPRLLPCSGMTRLPGSSHGWSTSLARTLTRNSHQKDQLHTRCSLARCMRPSIRSFRRQGKLPAHCNAPWHHKTTRTRSRSSSHHTQSTSLPPSHVHIRRHHPPSTSLPQSMRT